LPAERQVFSTGELDVLLHRVHWYLGQAHQVAAGLVGGTGAAVEDSRASLAELDQALIGQRRTVAELRRVLARRLLDERARRPHPA
jgi:hypothetical protein